MSTINQVPKKAVLIDARGPRYSAGITSLVLSFALITESVYVIGFQFAVFYLLFYLVFANQSMVLFIEA